MGLDMYLYAEKHKFERSDWGTIKYPNDLEALVKRTPYVSVTEKYLIGNWQGAEAVDFWMAKNCAEEFCRDGGSRYVLTEDDISELVEDCKKVLSNPDLAEEVLPEPYRVIDGKDERYLADLQYTVDLMGDVLALLKESPGWSISYEASW